MSTGHSNTFVKNRDWAGICMLQLYAYSHNKYTLFIVTMHLQFTLFSRISELYENVKCAETSILKHTFCGFLFHYMCPKFHVGEARIIFIRIHFT